ncbi:hypothetical protein WA158_004604 [Blastocystis sp. Blastoise]
MSEVVHSKLFFLARKWFGKTMPQFDGFGKNNSQSQVNEQQKKYVLNNRYADILDFPKRKLDIAPPVNNQRQFELISLASGYNLMLPNQRAAMVAIRTMINNATHGSMNIPASPKAIKSLHKIYSQCPIDCSICYGSVARDVYNLEMPCGHVFHRHCLVKWLEKGHTCPLCRFNLEEETIENCEPKGVIDFNEVYDRALEKKGILNHTGCLDFARLIIDSSYRSDYEESVMQFAITKSIHDY